MATQPIETAPPADQSTLNAALAANDGDGGSAGVEQDRDYEGEARAAGWKPIEEFGDDEKKPARPKDARTFVEEGERLASLQAPQIKALKLKVGALETQIKRLAKAEQMAYTNALADLKAQQEAAVEAGDVAAHREIDKKLDTLRESAKDTADVAHGEDPQDEFDNFRDKHAWYDRGNLASATDAEKDARAYADRVAERLARQGAMKDNPPSAFFEMVAEEVNARYPALANGRAPRPKPAPDVAGVTRTAANRNAKIGANLPPEAKDHAERYMRMGIYKNCKSKAEAYDRFAKDYTGPW